MTLSPSAVEYNHIETLRCITLGTEDCELLGVLLFPTELGTASLFCFSPFPGYLRME